MILGPLEAHFQRAFNTPNSIDFLSLKPEKIAREVHVQKRGNLFYVSFFLNKYKSIFNHSERRAGAKIRVMGSEFDGACGVASITH